MRSADSNGEIKDVIENFSANLKKLYQKGYRVFVQKKDITQKKPKIWKLEILLKK